MTPGRGVSESKHDNPFSSPASPDQRRTGSRADPQIQRQPAHAPQVDPKFVEQVAAQQAWIDFCGTNPYCTSPQGRRMREDVFLRPNSQADFVALTGLVKAASAGQSGAQLDQLLDVYEKHTPPVVLRSSVSRTAATIQALLENKVTADKLDQACFWSFLRDVGAQLTASTAAYTGSFFTFNSLLAKLMRSDADASIQNVAPQLAHTVASLLVQRFIRTAEMGPGWTRPVEADDKTGTPTAAILTSAGFGKTVKQYWPFFGPLLYASLGTADPVDATTPASKVDCSASRVELRRDWGFLATAGVALHRIFAFDREHLWLDASTPTKRQTMFGAIAELTDCGNTALALGKYLAIRPVAGVAGLAGIDLHPYINGAHEYLAGISSESQQAHPWPRPLEISGLLRKKGLSILRAAALMLPMGFFNSSRGFTSAAPEQSNLINVANDAFLIGAWGLAMASAERMVARDENLAAETRWRSERQQVALARRAGPPPDAIAPEPANV